MQIWPNGESPCIWMEAGIIDFKLCDRNHTCDDCPFNKIMTNGEHAYHINHFINHEEVTAIQEEASDIGFKYKNDPKKSFDIFERFRHFTFDPDIYYGNYYWFSELTEKTKIRIGLNFNALKMLPPLKEIIITQPGVTLEKGKPLCWLFTNLGSLSLNAPLNGKVIKINPKLLSQINTFNENHKVWILELLIPNMQNQLKTLLKGDKAKQFLMEQQNLIINTFDTYIKRISHETEPTLQDGGMLLFRLENVIGPQKYLEIITHLFHDSNSKSR
ncbi:hypothetical protein JXQ31_15000 [candidate division KSB1 bacterium]|nr:hypothetical protein [candidate division KSB1 bacterium]